MLEALGVRVGSGLARQALTLIICGTPSRRAELRRVFAYVMRMVSFLLQEDQWLEFQKTTNRCILLDNFVLERYTISQLSTRSLSSALC